MENTETNTDWTPDELAEIQRQLAEQQRNEVLKLREHAKFQTETTT